MRTETEKLSFVEMKIFIIIVILRDINKEHYIIDLIKLPCEYINKHVKKIVFCLFSIQK